MVRILRYILLLVLALVLLTVATANRSIVTLKALPEDIEALVSLGWTIDLPLFLVFFGGMALGLLVGFVWEWLREHRHRAEASGKAAEARRLQRELAAMRDAKGEVQDDVIALLDNKKG